MKLEYFLGLFFACSGIARANFEELRAAIENCDSQVFERVMQEMPDTYHGYFLKNNREKKGICGKDGFLKGHRSILLQAQRMIKKLSTEKEKESAVKIVTTLSKRVLKEQFGHGFKSLIMGTLFDLPAEVFFSFRQDPDLNKFIQDNANALYLQAIYRSFPGVPSILRKKYNALLPADHATHSVQSHGKCVTYTVFSHLALAFDSMGLVFDFDSMDLFLDFHSMHRVGNYRRYTPEDMEGLCREFVFLYEDFIKGVGKRTRSLSSEEELKSMLCKVLKAPLNILFRFSLDEIIESEEFLQSFCNKWSQGGLAFPHVIPFTDYRQEPIMYLESLREMTDILKEKHFGLFKSSSEKVLKKYKSELDFWEAINRPEDVKFEEESESESESEEKKSKVFVKKFLESREKYPVFYERNFTALKNFYTEQCAALLPKEIPEIA